MMNDATWVNGGMFQRDNILSPDGMIKQDSHLDDFEPSLTFS